MTSWHKCYRFSHNITEEKCYKESIVVIEIDQNFMLFFEMFKEIYFLWKSDAHLHE